MTKLRVSQTAKIEITGSGNVKGLKELLEKVPEYAITKVTVIGGGYNEYGKNYLEFNWSEEL